MEWEITPWSRSCSGVARGEQFLLAEAADRLDAAAQIGHQVGAAGHQACARLGGQHAAEVELSARPHSDLDLFGSLGVTSAHGAWSTGERRLALVFGLVVAAWLLRPLAPWAWAQRLGDSGVAMAGAQGLVQQIHMRILQAAAA